MKLRLARMGLMAAVLGAVAGCSSLDLGPEPSDYVGRSSSNAQALTDSSLDAVMPVVAGDHMQATDLGVSATMPGQPVSPDTMPAATQSTTVSTTQQAAPERPSTTNAPNPASGQLAVPAELNVQDAILVGLQNNVGLHIQRFSVPISRTGEEAALGTFDPQLSGQISGGRTASAPKDKNGPTNYSDSIDAKANVSQFLPTGTTINAGISSNNSFDNGANSSTDASLSVTQNLLRGFGTDVNLARIRSAELGTKISQYQLRGFAENLVATIEQSYWTLALDERSVVIVENALALAQEQLDSTNGSIKVGRVSPTEQAAAFAQLEQEKEQLINAKSTLEEDRLQFLQSITPAGQPFWNRTLALKTMPFIPEGTMDDVEKHVQVALNFRPEINETKLEIQQNDLTVIQTKNGLLPQLDFFVNLNKTASSSHFGTSITELNGPGYSAVAGISGSYDLGNHAADASYRSSLLSRDKVMETLHNFEQTIQVEVRIQYIEVERLRQQISATRATREADETSLRVEQAKFKDGRSTSLLVATAQQTLLSAQLSEVQAVTNHLKALVDLYRKEGSLLYRRGLEAPGIKPVDGIAWH